MLHLPLTLILPSLMFPLPWHGLVKFLVTTMATTGISLVLYEYCVRYTFIGTQMNGPRRRLVAEPVGSGQQVLDEHEAAAAVGEQPDSGVTSPRQSS